MKFWTLKDLAVAMQLHPRTVKRWWKLLNVKPSVAGNGCHRWTERRAKLLLKRWSAYWTARGHSPQVISQQYAGGYDDPAQLKFRFLKK